MIVAMPSIEETIAFIQHAHADVEYQPGVPYYMHPLRVMYQLPKSADIEVKLAALLHDVLEDTHYTADDLRAKGYTERTIRAVELVSKKSGVGLYTDELLGTNTKAVDYGDGIKALVAYGNMDAIMVKYADMKMNSNANSLARLPREKREWFEKKYTEPFRLLSQTLQDAGLLHAQQIARAV